MTVWYEYIPLRNNGISPKPHREDAYESILYPSQHDAPGTMALRTITVVCLLNDGG